MSTYLEFSIFSILFIFLTSVPFYECCPRACFCNMISRVVHCSERSLKHIPVDIPTDALQLNLNGNSFDTQTLKRENFTRLGLLEHLYLSKCNIRAIGVGTFIDLQRLKWLDLSKNRIRDLQDFTFRGLNLDQLFLNGNDALMLHKDTFNGLKVRGVFLHGCGLKDVSLEILRPINITLKSLTLNDNVIRKIGREMLYIFSSLSHLRLDSNPFHCNCEMSWLKQFFDRKPKIFKGALPPSCVTPVHASAETFKRLTNRDFRCQKPIFNGVDLVFSNEKGILRCIAGGDPAPTLYWIKPNGERNAYPPHHDGSLAKTQAIMTLNHVEGMYRGSYRCLAMNSGGNVTLTLNVTWPQIEKQTIIKYIERDPVVLDNAAKPNEKLNIILKEKDSEKDQKSKNASVKMFTMLDLVSAVLGTFASTLLVCVIVFHLLFRMRFRKLQLNELSNVYSQNNTVNLGRTGEEIVYTKDGIYSYPR